MFTADGTISGVGYGAQVQHGHAPHVHLHTRDAIKQRMNRVGTPLVKAGLLGELSLFLTYLVLVLCRSSSVRLSRTSKALLRISGPCRTTRVKHAG